MSTEDAIALRECDPIDVMEASDPTLREARAAIEHTIQEKR